ncbi:hypothetical protein [Megalodesulfovibrio gigas]|uniref:Uncharacterized protein n=1 Tax=Megalodesulfovibrio gigas (strain ATCC 19364 / DSM 1382 / NCIMB 9332 / VKM B-1759) TaxID=1121448 RepID=T2GFU9_MEGG1|nr:hypothetical protein [Megalodesulfovibrio gigas]AGW13860.1 hypothetical protein DGI_2093 [Megalodesulfovibrio gigas DSM 1382 = ATCC 19364]AGW15059.1 hypothetical protein DGI_3370 [Megalodesulfovibrio gigas DSM 1382 = ATCC 19364]
MRALSVSFMNDLLDRDGILYSLVERIRHDHTLMLSIRKDFINVYYRGGNILRIKEKGSGCYSSFFDFNYNRLDAPCPTLPDIINEKKDCIAWVKVLQELKGMMDCYFSLKCKPEREFQQLVARENNQSTISNQSEYFITDIEFSDSDIGARFDMLALRWLASQRKDTSSFRPALIEMKYGDNALTGNAGIIKHLQDINSLIDDRGRYQQLLETMESQFSQLDQLNLMRFNKISNWTGVKIDSNVKPEVVFILANHNPRSNVLKSILSDSEIDEFECSPDFDLKFFVSRFSGYALHAECLISLADFRKLI